MDGAEIVALGSALLVYAVGLISADQAFAGFGDPAVVYVAALFAVGAALRQAASPQWQVRSCLPAPEPTITNGVHAAALVTGVLCVIGAVLAAAGVRRSPEEARHQGGDGAGRPGRHPQARGIGGSRPAGPADPFAPRRCRPYPPVG
ncbi:hypothetical protein AB0D94_20700 [Streptomyces sp. NPDC048255]|uniref:hypothetical protein n=1 Tax=Streptomyces sp. NPDC048255 TaxID=3154713 RepID=UPI0033FDEAB3